MAAAHNLGGLRPHPPGRCPGPRPSSEMPPRVTTGAAAGIFLAGRVTGCRGTPAQVKGASGVAGDDAARHPCPARGTRGANLGARRGDTQAPWGLPGRAEPGNQAGRWTAQPDRCSIKQKRKMIRPAVPSGGGTVEDNSHPDQSIWGESSLHQTRGAPWRPGLSSWACACRAAGTWRPGRSGCVRR